MKTLAYYNGEITEIADMRIPLNDRAMYYGDGVYDASFAHNHVIWALEDHIERFLAGIRICFLCRLFWQKGYCQIGIYSRGKGNNDLRERFKGG